MTVLDAVVREAARRHGSRVAFVHEDRMLTYSALDAGADAIAAGLSDRGVAPGCLGGLLLPTGIDFALAYVALARLGAATTGVNPRSTPWERERLLGLAQVDVVIATPELLDAVSLDCEQVVLDPGAEDPWAAIAGESWRADRSTPNFLDPLAPETVVFTSGSTGLPKGALFTSRQIQAITEIDTGGQWGTGGPQLVGTGLGHVGFMTKLAGYLQLGTTMHMLSRWRAVDALRLIAQHRMRYVTGVAAQVALMCNDSTFDRYDWGAVEGIIVGAGPSPFPLVDEARRRFGAPYSIRYSSTESGGLGTLTGFDAPDAELSTVGRPRPGIELEIRDAETGAVCGPDIVGRICLRSPAVMERYWRNDVATAAAFDADRWLQTDDLGAVGEDGCLRITGRISEMFIRGGYNVSPQEVEAVLRDHPDVADAVVVPRPDAVMGEIGVAVIVARSNAVPPSLDALRAFAGTRLAPYKLPEALRVVDALSLTAMDKIDRRSMLENERTPRS